MPPFNPHLEKRYDDDYANEMCLSSLSVYCLPQRGDHG